MSTTQTIKVVNRVVDMNQMNGLCGWHEPDEWFVWLTWTTLMVCVAVMNQVNGVCGW
jgi:hypothetical protein